MRKSDQRFAKILLMVLLAAWMASANPSAHAESTAYRIVGYYAGWNIYANQYFVTDIPADELTHINYAFINVSEQGECILGDPWGDTQFLYPGDTESESLRGNFKQLQLLKQAHPHLKTLMSVGGWTWSSQFSDAALTTESRGRFARSCVAMMQQYGFDGIDIDWEFPVSEGLTPGRPEDKANFTLLLAELRAQLDAQGTADAMHYLLTIAAPAPAQITVNLQLDQIHVYLDWINLMTYQFHGGWSDVTNFHAALYPVSDDPAAALNLNTDAVIRAYLAAGVPADKLVLGVPFYGQAWGGVADVNHGLYQPFSSIPDGTWGDGTVDFDDLQINYLPAYTRYWHDQAQAPWLYNPATGIMITYEDSISLRRKAEYVEAMGLGGMMIWEVGYDDANHTLLSAIYNQFAAN